MFWGGGGGVFISPRFSCFFVQFDLAPLVQTLFSCLALILKTPFALQLHPRLPLVFSLLSLYYHPFDPLLTFSLQSLPQTRLALQKNMLGISSPSSDVEWRDDYSGEHPTGQ